MPLQTLLVLVINNAFFGVIYRKFLTNVHHCLVQFPYGVSASVFGEQSRLEPMTAERKSRWRKEIDWLLSVSDCIVEFVPSQQKAKDGSNMEVPFSHYAYAYIYIRIHMHYFYFFDF